MQNKLTVQEPFKILSIYIPAQKHFKEKEVYIENADMKSLNAKNLFRIYMSGVRKIAVEMTNSEAVVCALVQFRGSVWIQLPKI